MGRLKRTIAAVLDVDVGVIGDDASSETIAAWDSVKQMDILLAVEDEFDVRFGDELLPELSSFRRIVEELIAIGVLQT
jgi:acyl carrier protein